jgi:hypothetical protein
VLWENRVSVNGQPSGGAPFQLFLEEIASVHPLLHRENQSAERRVPVTRTPLSLASPYGRLENDFEPLAPPVHMLRKISSAITLLLLLASPASGFDTFWHQEAVRRGLDRYAFCLAGWTAALGCEVLEPSPCRINAKPSPLYRSHRLLTCFGEREGSAPPLFRQALRLTPFPRLAHCA